MIKRGSHLRLVADEERTPSRRLGRVAQLPPRWTATVRARRLLFVLTCAPGFLAVFTTTWHRNLFVLAAGLVLFGAAVALRRFSEPRFLAATAPGAWPPLSTHQFQETPHA